MCGIAGIFDPRGIDQIHSRQLVKSAISEIRHRGPDEQGFFSGDHSALGMCRLSIIDVTGGQQPNYGNQRRVVSVFNGEIYNFGELKAELIRKGYPVRGAGDSECIPFLYEEYGDEFPKYLQGMFAIALWDHFNNRGLLVRDRLGKKPLWFHSERSRVTFASEVKGLLKMGVPRVLDEQRIPEFLQFGYINAPRSSFKNVSQLRPGSVLAIEEGIYKEGAYWHPIKVATRTSTFEEAKEQTHSLIRDAVSTRLVSERPIGAFLSGGIDSSLVTALMSKELGADTHTFSIGFKESNFDESRYATAVAGHLGTRHNEKIVSPDETFIVEKIARVLDQPFADSSIIPTFLLSEFAHEKVVVALGGDGGDEVFGGYVRYRIARILSKVNFLLAVSPTPLLQKFVANNPKVEKLFRYAKFSSGFRRYLGFQSLIQRSELRDLLIGEIQEIEQEVDFLDLWKSVSDSSYLRTMQSFDLLTYLPGDLMYKADMASMASSLELRSPLLDYRVVQHGLSLPDEFKIHRGVSKRILREILYEYVPKELVDRPKMGFGIPRAEWLRGGLSNLVKETLFAKDASVSAWLDMGRMREIVESHNGGTNRDLIIWPVLMLELWAKNWLN